MPADAAESAYEELQFYSLSRAGSDFIHQHVVDAWAAQTAGESTRAIGLAFALAGLYLRVERGFSGRQIQRVHVLLGARKESWPEFELPADRGAVTASEVMAAPAGPERDRMIDRWCASVWGAYSRARPDVVAWLGRRGIG